MYKKLKNLFLKRKFKNLLFEKEQMEVRHKKEKNALKKCTNKLWHYEEDDKECLAKQELKWKHSTEKMILERKIKKIKEIVLEKITEKKWKTHKSYSSVKMV